jgi:MFS family permease
MAFDIRTLAVPTAGFATFLNLYSPQALLPRLSHDFNVTAGEISSLITAATVAIALTAPFTGALADVLGRKRLITAAMFAIVVPTLLMTLASSVPQLVALRFVQGLLVPPIFTVTVAYIGDEWPPGEVTRVAGLYTAGSSFGGFCGRLIPGFVTDLLDWRAAFAANALLTLAVAIAVAFMLPRERYFVRSEGLLASSRQILAHLHNPRLLAIYAVGFGVLFNFTSVFTYVNFHLALPPYLFSPTLLGAVSSPTSPVAYWCPGSAAASPSSAAAISCLASSRCGSPARCCSWRRRSASSSPGWRCAPPAASYARPPRRAMSLPSPRRGARPRSVSTPRSSTLAAAPVPSSPGSHGTPPAGPAASR